MEFLQIILTVLVVGIMIFAIAKKFNPTTTMLCLGLVILFIYLLITGMSPMGEESSGSSFLDLFELVRTKFVSNLSGTGILIMSVMGYVYYMNHLKASTLLALVASKPLKKLKSPYICVALSFVIAALLKLCLPSHASLTTLLMATVYPILLAVGVKRKTAAACVVLGGGFDLGPACPITNWVIQQEGVSSLSSVANFFVVYQIPITICMLIVTAAVFIFLAVRIDKKDTDTTDELEGQDPKSLGIPMFYAVLPVIPLLLVLVFSDLIVKSISISVVGANILGFIAAFLINLIFGKGSKQEAYNGTKKFWEGMGNGFTNVVAMICTASVFTAGLSAIGGMSIIMNSLTAIGNGTIGVAIAAGAIGGFTALVTGSGLAAVYTIVPIMIEVISPDTILSILAPVISCGGIMRAVSPISGAVIVAATVSGVDVIELTKRNIIPALSGMATALIASFILL